MLTIADLKPFPSKSRAQGQFLLLPPPPRVWSRVPVSLHVLLLVKAVAGCGSPENRILPSPRDLPLLLCAFLAVYLPGDFPELIL